MIHKNHHLFTKEEIKSVARLWSDKTVQEIAKELNITGAQVVYLAKQMRKEGFVLSQKRRNGETRFLIREVLSSGQGSV